MSIGNYIGIGGAIVVFGMTINVLMREYLAPWLVSVLHLTARVARPTPRKPKVRGVVISFRVKR